MTEENFLPCLETLKSFIQGRVGGDRSAAALELLANTGMALVKSACQAEAVTDKGFLKWMHVLNMLSQVRFLNYYVSQDFRIVPYIECT